VTDVRIALPTEDKWVTASHVAGVWGIHRGADRARGWCLTHVPTGRRLLWHEDSEALVLVLDALGKRALQWEADAEWRAEPKPAKSPEVLAAIGLGLGKYQQSQERRLNRVEAAE
jgi:hypothetical protein